MKTYELVRPIVGQSTAQKLVPVIRHMKADRHDAALAELVRLTGYRELESEPREIPTCEAPTVGRGVLAPAGMQPKPAERIIDEALLRRFHERHPVCWVIGCGRPSGPAHHLRRRSDHGDDVEGNLFSLCVFHHVMDALSFHEIRPYGSGFYVVYANRLALDHKARMVAALPEIEDEVPRILAGEIELHPARARALIAA